MTLHRISGAVSRPASSSLTPRVECGDPYCVPCAVLSRAGERVVAQWSRRPRSTTASEVADLLHVLTAGVHGANGGGTEPVTIEERARSTLGRRLLELLRGEVVRGWTEHGGTDTALLPLLVAMERVRVAIEPNWAQSFAAHLSGSEGLTLLMDVAHDLRSPLTSILVLAETLQRGQSGDVNDVQRRQLGLIYTAALRLSSVASDIIEFTQGGDRLVDQEPVPFSVTAMLESVRDIVRPIAEEKHLTMRLLAPTADERMGHPVALSRVLLNLTTNALKFTDTGYVEIVAQELPGSRVEFAVRDSGKGMDAATITTLFQPLRRAANRRGQLFSQTGLGLTICRKLAAAMGSELKVESRIGWGTRFYFALDLPVCPRQRVPARITAHGGARGSDPRRASPLVNGKKRRA